MATNAIGQQEKVTARALQPERVASNRRLAGFGNMFAKEIGEWFGTRRWIVQALAWMGIINGLVGFFVLVAPAIEQMALEQAGGNVEVTQTGGPLDVVMLGLSMFFTLAAFGGAIGVIILGQDEIVGEKQLGTAAWILSKPVARPAFILSKLVANLAGVLLFVLAIPAALTYATLWLAAGQAVDPLGFVLGTAVIGLLLLFYLTLSLMLGVLFSQRGPLLAFSLGLLLGGGLLMGIVPQLALVLPLRMDAIGMGLATGAGLNDMALIELATTIGWIVVFTAVAIWRFEKQEI